MLKQCFKENTRFTDPLPAVGEHRLNTGHNIPLENLKILDCENWDRRRVKEAIHIKQQKQKLNLELPAIYDHVVSRDWLPPKSCDAPNASKP